MGWITNNLFSEKRLTEKIFSSQFSITLINSILTMFIITMKLRNSKKSNTKQELRLVISVVQMHGI